MTAVTPYSVDGRYDVVLYTHRTTRDSRPITTALGLRTGLSVFEADQRVGAASYPRTVAVAVIIALLRIAAVTLVFPAILVTLWLTAALSPFVLFLALALVESRLSFDLSVFGRSIEPRRENGILLFFAEVLLIGVSAAAVVYINEFQTVLRLTLQNVMLALPIAAVVVVSRALVSYVGSDKVSRTPEPMEQSVTTTEFNRLVEAVNYQLPDPVSPIPTVPAETATPKLAEAVTEEGIDTAFVNRIEATGHRGEAAADLDRALRRTLGERYTSPYDGPLREE